MSAENAWRIAMEAAMAEAEEVEINPIPSLWNFGTTPRPADRAEWKGRKEGAQDVRVLLASLPMPPAFRAAVEAEVEELRGMLAEALPLVEEREFLAETEYSYGSGWPEPSPSEWGIHCGYQQTADAMPYQQFEEDVERHHRTNREEDDGDGEFLTLANRIRALLSRLEAKGESHE